MVRSHPVADHLELRPAFGTIFAIAAFAIGIGALRREATHIQKERR